MILFGLLVLVGVAGISLAVIWANDGVFTTRRSPRWRR
jgi:hypothetical protein